MKKRSNLSCILISTIFFYALITMNMAFAGNGSGGNKDNPLALVESTPYDGQENVTLSPEIKLTFSKNVVNMRVAEGNQECFSLHAADGTNVPVEVQMADDQIEREKRNDIILIPLKELQSGIRYTIKISERLESKSGVTLGNDLQIEFITKDTSVETKDEILKDEKITNRDTSQKDETVNNITKESELLVTQERAVASVKETKVEDEKNKEPITPQEEDDKDEEQVNKVDDSLQAESAREEVDSDEKMQSKIKNSNEVLDSYLNDDEEYEKQKSYGLSIVATGILVISIGYILMRKNKKL